MNSKIRKDIEKRGEILLDKPDGLISNFSFETANKVSDSYGELIKLYPTADFL